ncbi:MAG: response regulator [Acidimicrobiales bacterium]
MPIRVVLVDDTADLRVALARLLRVRGGFEVVAEGADGADAIAAAREHQPDIVVLDLGFPDLAGHEVLTALRRESPGAMIVVYSGSITPDRLPSAEAADAFLEKSHDMPYVVDFLADVGRRVRRTAMLHVGPATDDVGRARHFAVERCNEWGCGDAADDVSLIVSELVANALVHGRSACELTLGYGGGSLRVEVVDYGGGVPDLKAASAETEHGRGLMLVSMLCAAWGTEPRSGGKCVWADLVVARASTTARGPSGGATVRDASAVSGAETISLYV